MTYNFNAEVDCGDLFDPTNGGVSVNSTTFNSTATYTCDSGYSLVGDTTRICLASGLWSGIVPNCTGIYLTPQK